MENVIAKFLPCWNPAAASKVLSRQARKDNGCA
jgi:hypothetical protein